MIPIIGRIAGKGSCGSAAKETWTIEAIQFEDFFELRLHKYDVDKAMVSEEEKEQQDITTRLREAKIAFVNARRGDSSTRQREHTLQSLESAYLKYEEIISNLDASSPLISAILKLNRAIEIKRSSDHK